MASRPSLPPYRPQLALLVDEAPEGDAWLHEMKYDGYRIGCAVEGGRASLWSRRGKDWTAQFPEVAAAARSLPIRSALLDGEVAVLLPDGRTSFQALQNAFGGAHRERLVYFAFDLLQLDGQDLGSLPLSERKAALARLLGEGRGIIRYAPHLEGGGEAVFREACRLGLEGIVSKRRDRPYLPGRNATWVKTKCLLRQELVIGGFTDPEGAARDAIGALLVGHFEAGVLRFAGKVGTGFTNAAAQALRARLGPLETKACPFSPRPPGRLGNNAHWVRPELVCEVAFTEWTEDGKARHPSFQGLREDKAAREVRRERPAPAAQAERSAAATSKRRGGTATSTPAADSTSSAPARPTATARRKGPSTRASGTSAPVRTERGAAAPAAARSRRAPRESGSPQSAARSSGKSGHAEEVAGVRISNADRVVYPDLGATKGDVARYYAAVADAILPHLTGRPLTLYRCPTGLAGECHFMKHAKTWGAGAIRRVRIPEQKKVGEYLVVDTVEALLSVVQMGVLELHTWNSTVERLEEPDRIVLDLDPGPRVRFTEVVRAARTVREALGSLGLASFVKTTGGAGLHVVAPLVPERPWQECFAFTRALATALARREPRRFTVQLAKSGREDLILVDYLRNSRTNTSVAAFSTRARPGAPVSVPLAWDELSPGLRPERFTLRSVPRRLASLGTDPWRGWERARRTLDRVRQDAVAGLEARL